MLFIDFDSPYGSKNGYQKSGTLDNFGGLGPPAPQEGPKDPPRHPPRSKSYPKRYLNGRPTHHFYTRFLRCVLVPSYRSAKLSLGCTLTFWFSFFDQDPFPDPTSRVSGEGGGPRRLMAQGWPNRCVSCTKISPRDDHNLARLFTSIFTLPNG